MTPNDLLSMQTEAEASMQDTCVLLTPSTATGTYGGGIAAYTDGATSKCGLSWSAATNRAATNRGPMPEIDAVLRLPLALAGVLTPQHRIKFTHRYGHVLPAPWVFTIVGQPQVGPTCIMLNLKKFG